MDDKSQRLLAMLPHLQTEWENMNAGTMKEYEDTLNESAQKAVKLLKDMIEDGTMGLDVQTAVNAASVLTKAQKDLIESKRKLIEITMKGMVMMKALADEPKRESAIDAYASRFRIEDKTEQNYGNNSIFGMIDAEKNKDDIIPGEVKNESKLESSANQKPRNKRGRPAKNR